MYTIEQMEKAFEMGRNFQLTGENNFQELIDKLGICASCNQEVKTHELCIDCVTKMIENDN
jgi:hypothetical protein